MAPASAQIAQARYYCCALVASIAFVLQGCSSLGSAQCDLDEFKANAEPCLDAIDLPADKCMNITGSVHHCLHISCPPGSNPTFNSTGTWMHTIIDNKFVGAKTAFMDNAKKCLKTATFDEVCQTEHKKKVVRDCRKQAEDAAGSEFKEDAQSAHQSHECPQHWLHEAMTAAQPDYAAWHIKECPHHGPQ